MKNKLLLEITRQKKLMGILNEVSTGPSPYGWGGVFLKKLFSTTDAAVSTVRSRFSTIYDNLKNDVRFSNLKNKGVQTFDELVDDTKKINTSSAAAVKGTNEEYIQFAKEFIFKIFRESGNEEVRELCFEKYKEIFEPGTKKVLEDLDMLAKNGQKEAFESMRQNAERGGHFDPTILNYLESKIPKTKREFFIDPQDSQLEDEAFKNFVQRLDPEDQTTINKMITHAKNDDYEAFFADKKALKKPLEPEMLRYVERYFSIDVPTPTFLRNMWNYFYKHDLLTGKIIFSIYRKLAGITKTTIEESTIQFRNIIDGISDDIEKGLDVDPKKIEQLNQLSRRISEFERKQIKTFWDNTKAVMPTPFLTKIQDAEGNFDENMFLEWIRFYESASGKGSMLIPPKFTGKIDGFIRLFTGAGSDGVTDLLNVKNRLKRLGRYALRGTLRLSEEIKTNNKLLGGKPNWWLNSTQYAGYQVGELIMSTLIYAPVFVGVTESLLGLLGKNYNMDLPIVDEEPWSGGDVKSFEDAPGEFFGTIRDIIVKDFKLNIVDAGKVLSKGYSPALYLLVRAVIRSEKGGAPDISPKELEKLLPQIQFDSTEAHKALMQNVPDYRKIVDTTTFRGYNGNMDSLMRFVMGGTR